MAHINEHFGVEFEKDFGSDGAPLTDSAVRYQSMKSKREGQGTDVVKLVPTPKGEARKFAARVGDTIAEILNSIGLNATKSGKPSVALIARSVSELKQCAHALSERHVPFSISHSRGFFDLPEIAPLISFLSVLADSTDAAALVAVLRSYLFGVSEVSLLKARVEIEVPIDALFSRNRNASEILLSKCLNEEVKNSFDDLLAIAQFLRPSEALQKLVNERRVIEILSELSLRERARNIQRFIDWVRKAESSGRISAVEKGLTYRSVESWIQQERKKESSAPNAFNSASPVVLMTIHGSKGLEFPTVVALERGGSHQERSGFYLSEIHGEAILFAAVEDEEGGKNRALPLLAALQVRADKLASHAEERRLSYVARTRAESALIVIN